MNAGPGLRAWNWDGSSSHPWSPTRPRFRGTFVTFVMGRVDGPPALFTDADLFVANCFSDWTDIYSCVHQHLFIRLNLLQRLCCTRVLFELLEWSSAVFRIKHGCFRCMLFYVPLYLRLFSCPDIQFYPLPGILSYKTNGICFPSVPYVGTIIKHTSNIRPRCFPSFRNAGLHASIRTIPQYIGHKLICI